MGIFNYVNNSNKSSLFGDGEEIKLEHTFTDEAEQELREAFIYDEIAGLPQDLREQFVQGPGQELCEAGIIGRKTLVRLSKIDDLERRIRMASLQLAKTAKDPLYDQLEKNRIKERMLLNKIDAKYATRASRTAKQGQKQYLKSVPAGYLRTVFK